MEERDRDLLRRALDVLEDQNERAAQDQHAETVALAKALRPPEPDHERLTERIAKAEAVVAYAESAARARVAVERWATTSPLAGAA